MAVILKKKKNSVLILTWSHQRGLALWHFPGLEKRETNRADGFSSVSRELFSNTRQAQKLVCGHAGSQICRQMFLISKETASVNATRSFPTTGKRIRIQSWREIYKPLQNRDRASGDPWHGWAMQQRGLSKESGLYFWGNEKRDGKPCKWFLKQKEYGCTFEHFCSMMPWNRGQLASQLTDWGVMSSTNLSVFGKWQNLVSYCCKERRQQWTLSHWPSACSTGTWDTG